jgi:hypothetical protein
LRLASRDLRLASRVSRHASRNPRRPARVRPGTSHKERMPMWALIKSLLLKWSLFKILLKSLGSLAWLIPVAFILKAIGIPALMLLAVLALPLILVLVMLGLPLLLIVIVGGGLLMVTFWIVSIGLVALKIALPIILVFWVVRWLTRRNGDEHRPPDVIRPEDATP